ncbi:MULTISPECIES: hypothetical protein [unclassified Klebsiella]|uniref:hypothetical protein n=1 Tax=unclassified Klebsiella TaxID=2608929 RepID=UPI001D17DCB0|nr:MULTISPECIES: hypothetical protein [unclassified Klebsiella]
MPQKENRNRENTMKNLKIEYVDGQLVTVEVEGVSMLNVGLSGLNFSHFLGKEPHLKFEVGGESPNGLDPVQPQSAGQEKEGELLAASPPNAPHARSPRSKNRNRNRSH